MQQCPVCSSSSYKLRNSFSTEESAAHICPPSRNLNRYQRLNKVLQQLWPAGKCQVYECQHCGFGFADPHIGGNEAYYQILHEQMGYPAWRWDYDIALDKIRELEAGKILDIGAGSGNFLQKVNPKFDKYALESSDLTLKQLKKKGIKGSKDINELITAHKDQFMSITLFQVLEHLADFNSILKDISNLLHPKGYLIITVPDAVEMFRQEAIIGYADMPPNHINKWTIKSLGIALEKYGLQVIDSGKEKKSVKNLLSKIHMKILADSMKKGKLAYHIYKIQNKKLRTLFIAMIAPFILLQKLSKFNFLLQGGALYVVAKKA